MEITKTKSFSLSSLVYLTIVFISAALYLVWFTSMHHQAEVLFRQVEASMATNAKPIVKYVSVSKGKPAIMMLRSQPLRPTSVYVYVSNAHPFKNNFIPQDLTRLHLAHASNDRPFQLNKRAAEALKQLFTAAKKDHQPLIVSSAYRSEDDQAEVMNSYRTEFGEAVARKYVSRPGSSEHQTGLAVDVNNYSPACELDADQCNISPATSAWLAEHAPQYGFIIRYPKGKENITGINYEPWHLRYIGNAASVLTASGLTYDEFARKADPSLFKD